MKLPRPFGTASPGHSPDIVPTTAQDRPKVPSLTSETQKTHNKPDSGVPARSARQGQSTNATAKDQVWGDLGDQLSQEGSQQQAPATPMRPTAAAKKPRTSSEKRRSGAPAADVSSVGTCADIPQPKRGFSSIAAKHQQLTRPRRPITKRVKLEQPKIADDNYEISDLEEDVHGNRVEPDRSQKRVPSWCANYVQTAEAQAEVDPDSIFGSHMPICDLDSCLNSRRH